MCRLFAGSPCRGEYARLALLDAALDQLEPGLLYWEVQAARVGPLVELSRPDDAREVLALYVQHGPSPRRQRFARWWVELAVERGACDEAADAITWVDAPEAEWVQRVETCEAQGE